jgi:hypothetical protein
MLVDLFIWLSLTLTLISGVDDFPKLRGIHQRAGAHAIVG